MKVRRFTFDYPYHMMSLLGSGIMPKICKKTNFKKQLKNLLTQLLTYELLIMKNNNLIRNLLLLGFFILSGYIQAQEVKGKVMDANGPLPGANVRVKGTMNGTVADFDGNYVLKNVNGTDVLQFSFMGYQNQEVSVNGKSVVNVVMSEGANQLDEVVVTALGIKRETKALGYATQKVSGDVLTKVSGVDVGSSLTGKVSGLLVRNTPDFNAAPVISIRGELPLLVIDGVPYQNKTLSDVSSEDIESVNVLKGATASALYGFRGASGAILVTTKNGSTNLAGLSVDYTNNTMWSAGFLALPEKQGVYGRGGSNMYDKYSDESWGTVMDGTIRNQWDPFLKEYADYPYVNSGENNFENFLEDGYITNNNLNIGYKGDVASVRGSVNWTENKGVYPNQKSDRYTYSLGGDINLEKFQLSSNMSYSKKETPNQSSNSYTAYDPMYSLLIWSSTDFDLRDYKDYWIKPDETQNYTLPDHNNPYYNMYERTNEVNRDIFNADLTVSYQLTDWLKATARAGADYYTDQGELRVSWGSRTSTGNTGVPGNPWTWFGGQWEDGGYMIGQNQGNSINADLLFNGDTSFDKFNVEYLVGGTIFKKTDDNIRSWTSGGISVPGFFSLDGSVNPSQTASTTEAQQVNSVYGRAALSYNKWAYFEVTGRNDWSSTMVNTASESYFYPSTAMSIVVSELLGESTKSWLDLLKVRYSWTNTKTPAGIYDTTENSVFGINSGTWGSANGAYAPSNLYGSDLRPQSTTTTEVGLQAILFKNRLNFDIAYYNKDLYDFLTSAPLSGASGFTGRYINIDEEQARRGWEITLGGSLLKTDDWQWDMNFNWSTYARYYTKIDPIYSPKKDWIADGERVDAMVSRDYLRVPETGEQIWANGKLQFNPYDTKFGYTDPDFIWGLNSTLRYKNLSLFVSFDGINGGLINSRTESYMWQAGVHPNSVTPERALDVATPGSQNYLGDGVKVVSGSYTYDQFGNITSDTRVYAPNDVKSTYKAYVKAMHGSSAWGGNGTPADTYEKTFFKLRELALTYTLPVNLTKGWAKAASIGFVGQNVFLWAKDFTYSDPDGSGYNYYGSGANATGTVEDFSDPAMRYLGGNIKITL